MEEQLNSSVNKGFFDKDDIKSRPQVGCDTGLQWKAILRKKFASLLESP